jgi:hypothetical protein
VVLVAIFREFNIIGVMRGNFWGFLSGFRELLVAEIELDF